MMSTRQVGIHHNAHYGVADLISKCGQTCTRPTPTQAHCAAAGCHATFGGVSLFDRHRRRGECLPPADLGMTEVRGVWRIPMDEEARSRRFPLTGGATDGPECPGGSTEPPKINNTDLVPVGRLW